MNIIKKSVFFLAICTLITTDPKHAHAKGFSDDIREWNQLRFEQERIKAQVESAANSTALASLNVYDSFQKEDLFLENIYEFSIETNLNAHVVQILSLANAHIQLKKHSSFIIKQALDNFKLETTFTKSLEKISKGFEFSSFKRAEVFLDSYLHHLNTLNQRILKLELQTLNQTRKLLAEELINTSYIAYDAAYESIRKNCELYRAEFQNMLSESMEKIYDKSSANNAGIEEKLERQEERSISVQGLEGSQETIIRSIDQKNARVEREIKKIITILDKKYPPFVATISKGEVLKISYSDYNSIYEFYARSEKKFDTIITNTSLETLPADHRANQTLRSIRQNIRNLRRYQAWSNAYNAHQWFVKFKKLLIPLTSIGFVVFSELLFADELEAPAIESPEIRNFVRQVTLKTEQLKSLFWVAFFENNASAMENAFVALTNSNFFKEVLAEPVRDAQSSLIVDTTIFKNKAYFETLGNKLASYYQIYSTEIPKQSNGEPATLQIRK